MNHFRLISEFIKLYDNSWLIFMRKLLLFNMIQSNRTFDFTPSEIPDPNIISFMHMTRIINSTNSFLIFLDKLLIFLTIFSTNLYLLLNHQIFSLLDFQDIQHLQNSHSFLNQLIKLWNIVHDKMDDLFG